MSQLDQAEEDRHENVKAWFKTVPENALYVSAVTVMEAWMGLARERKRSANDLSRLGQCDRYEEAFDKLIEAFSNRVVPIDGVIGKLWGEMLGQQDKNRFDTCLAATAVVLKMVVATRNTADFSGRGARIVNPFSSAPRVE